VTKTPFARTALLLAVVTTTALLPVFGPPGSAAGAVAPAASTAAAVGWRDAALVYTDGPTTATALAQYLRVGGDPSQAALYDALIINDQSAPSGARYEYGPSYATDWQALLDSYATADGRTGTLVNLVAAASATRRTDVKVVLGLPWPDTTNGGFRTPTGRVVNFGTAAGRSQAVADFVTVARQRWVASGASAAGISLWGAYWEREDLGTGDSQVVASATAAIRAQGLRTLWVPYYNAPMAAQWAGLGFDAMSWQSNYAFYTAMDGGDTTSARLTATVRAATAAAAGFTIEVRGAAEDTGDLGLLREYLAADRTMSPSAIRVHFLGMDKPLPLATGGSSPQGWRELSAAMIARRVAAVAPEATAAVATDGTAPVALPAEGQITVSARTATTALAVAEQQNGAGTWVTRGWTVLSPNAEEPGAASALLPLTAGAAGGGRIRLTMAAGAVPPGRLSATVTPSAAPPVVQVLPGTRYQVSGAAVTGAGAYPDQGQLIRASTPPPGSWTSGEALGWSGEPDRAGVLADLGGSKSLRAATLLVAGGGSAGVGWPRHVTMLLAGCRLRTTSGAGPLPCAVTPLSVAGPTAVHGTGASLTGTWTGAGPAVGRWLVVRSTVSTWSMWERLRATATDGSALPLTYTPLLPPSPAVAQTNYPDDGLRLTDGNAADALDRYLVTGFPASNAGAVTLSYDVARVIGQVDIWLVHKPTWGVLTPSSLVATVNGASYPMSCAAGPADAMRCHAALPRPTATAAVAVSWPVAGPPSSWVMVSEVAAAA
jgi:hypothetical protein